MKPKNLLSLNSSLEDVRNQFENWRLHRKKRVPIPTSLWQAAVSLFPQHSVYEISKALRLNYTDLKHRVEAQRSVFQSPAISEPAFFELGGLSAPMSTAQCIVEMQHPDGAKMKMYFKGDVGLDLLQLGKTFWSKGA
jgi:hypothetical protein